MKNGPERAVFHCILAERAGLGQLSSPPSIHAGFRGITRKMFPDLFPGILPADIVPRLRFRSKPA